MGQHATYTHVCRLGQGAYKGGLGYHGLLMGSGLGCSQLGWAGLGWTGLGYELWAVGYGL